VGPGITQGLGTIVPMNNAQKMEEVARTVYVGNVNSQVSAQQLMAFFAGCGDINYCRMAGDDSHPSRFSFIEFATLEAAQKAMGLNGSTLLDRPVRVNHSKNPIVKPPPKPVDPREKAAIQRRLSRIVDSINNRVDDDDGSNEKKTSSRSASRERHSSSSRERHSRSTGRHKSGSRAKEKDNGKEQDKEKDKKRHKHRSKKHRSKSRDRKRKRSDKHNEDTNRRKRRRSGDNEKDRDSVRRKTSDKDKHKVE